MYNYNLMLLRSAVVPEGSGSWATAAFRQCFIFWINTNSQLAPFSCSWSPLDEREAKNYLTFSFKTIFR